MVYLKFVLECDVIDLNIVSVFFIVYVIVLIVIRGCREWSEENYKNKLMLL